jgi:hypothetical protein
MAVVVVGEMERGNQEIFDKISGKVMPDGGKPEGLQVQIAGPSGSGWRVITVWDSEDQFHKFRNERLLPALREVVGEEGVAPEPSIEPVHRLITP